MQDATVAHVLPGRIRLRFASRRGDVPFFEELVRTLSANPLVDRVKANPRTGSLLVEHSAGPAELAAFAAQSGLPIPLETPRAGSRARSRGRPPAGRNGRRLSAAAATLSGLGVYQVARGRLLGSAGELLWHSLGLSGRTNAWVLGVLLAAGLVQVLRGRWLPPASSLLVYAIQFDEMWGRRGGERAATAVRPSDASLTPLAPEA